MTDKTPVEAITHDADRRANIPPAELEPVLDPKDRAPIKAAYARRDPDLDPQLVWRGKDMTDWSDLVVDAPPIYLQEQIHPKALIEDLRASARGDRPRSGADLFEHFGIGAEDREAEVEFYRHSRRWSNRMILGDALQVMASLAEREGLRGQVQAIYIDPPYGIRFNSNFQWSTTSRDVKNGDLGHLTREPEQVKAFRDTWRDGVHSYLTYLRDRLTVARELLTEFGSCFVQIGDENVHRVRALMDEVFGEENFVAQIAFIKTTSATAQYLSGTFDYLLWFSRSLKSLKYREVLLEKTLGESGTTQYVWQRSETFEDYRISKHSDVNPEYVFAASDLKGQTGGETTRFDVLLNGHRFSSGKGGWKTSSLGLERLVKASRPKGIGKSLMYRRFLRDSPFYPATNHWFDVLSTGFSDERFYVVQTGAKVVQRCLLMTTDPGDLVLDPTCGSGTSAFVAEQWGRRWITIDTSRVALALARARIMGAKYPYYLLADSPEGRRKEAEVSRTTPPATPTQGDIRQGFVYERVPHVTLKSIANNAEIDVIWDRLQPAVEAARAALNEALTGHAERYPIDSGGRAGDRIDFTAPGETKMPSGELAPVNGFMEWEVPRKPGTPSPRDQARLRFQASLYSPDGTSRVRAEAEAALAELNKARGTSWDLDTLPVRQSPLGRIPLSRRWRPSGRRASPVSARSTPRSPPAPSTNTSTTSPTMTAAQAAGLGLANARGAYQVHVLPSGAEVLSLAAAFGTDAGGLIGDLQPFIGNRDFALFVSRAVVRSVVRSRWRSNPAARDFTSDVTVRIPVSEGSETLGDGTARVNVRLGELTDAGIMAAVFPPGDILRLECNEQIQILGVWWPGGQPLGDLGELGEAIVVSMTVNVAPFAEAPLDTDLQAPFRLFLLSVLEPLAVPLLDRLAIEGMDGFLSEARDALVCRWRLADTFPDVGSIPDIAVVRP